MAILRSLQRFFKPLLSTFEGRFTFLFLTRMKSAYSFLVLKLRSESLLLSDIDVVLLKGEIKKELTETV